MDKYAKFEVPAEVLGEFVQEISNRGLAATTSGPNHRGEYNVTVPYDKDNEDEVDELSEHLDGLISDLDSQTDDER